MVRARHDKEIDHLENALHFVRYIESHLVLACNEKDSAGRTLRVNDAVRSFIDVGKFLGIEAVCSRDWRMAIDDLHLPD